MPYYRRVGDVPPKRHTVHRGRNGERLLEELVGSDGFSGASSLLYHRRSPSAVASIDAVDEIAATLAPNDPVTPLHLRTTQVAPGRDLVTGRTVLLANEQVSIAVASGHEASPIYRDAIGDELVFVSSGDVVLESVFGPLNAHAGDYVVVPRGVTHRWLPSAGAPVRALVVESRSHVRVPRHYLTPEGQFIERAPFCERDLRAPTMPLDDVDADAVLDPLGDASSDGHGPFDVLVRTRAGSSRHRMVNHPFDVVGWDGCLYPYALSISDFEPIVGSLHQPPPVHQTFEGDGFVLCSFVPRPFDFHPDAVKIPYHHSNVDSDEVLFYVGGDFMSRAGAGIEVGSMTVHPSGFIHGPQPGSWERSVDATATNETAVMIDTFAPLLVSDAARRISDPSYLSSWSD